MIYHVLLALVLLVYLELSGQYILSKLNKSLPLGFPIGLMALMAYGYMTTSLLTANDCSFYLVLAIYGIYVLGSIILIIKDFKKIKWHFSPINLIVCSIFAAIMTYYSWNTKLGDLNGFDSVYYLNLISTNIKATSMNTTSLYYGGVAYDINIQYKFQSYFYFVSCFVYIGYSLLSRLISDMTYASITIWVFQIIYSYFLASLVINVMDVVGKNKKILKYVMLYIFLFFYGKTYYSSVFGFYGNSYRTMAISYAMLFLYEIFKNNEKEDWLLFGISINAACAFSSTGSFISILILFGAFFSLVKKEDKVFKYYALIWLFPLTNACAVFLGTALKGLLVSLVLSIIMFIFNDKLVKLFRTKYVSVIFLGLCTLAMFIMSFRLTGNIINLDRFLDNDSERYDMTMNLFKDLQYFGIDELYYKYLFRFYFIYLLIFKRKEPLTMTFICLVIALFNPFCYAWFSDVNIVYYRAYEIYFNPFVFMLCTCMIIDLFKNKYVYYVLSVGMLILFMNEINYKTPKYYNKDFIPDESYNKLMKMDNDEYEVIKYLKEDIDYYINDNSSPYIVSTNLLTESIIPYGRYLLCREELVNNSWNDAEKQIYSMFNAYDYKGQKNVIVDKVDYDNLDNYFKDAGINYLVINKTETYYDEDLDLYTFLTYKVAEGGYAKSIYNNDTYELFKMWDE